MKKIYSLLLACIATSPVLNAKTTGISVPNIFPHMGSESNSPMAFNSRITAYIYLKHNGSSFVPVDSTTYSYAFGRGGQLTKEEMDDNFVNFDDSYTYTYTPGGYKNDTHRWQVFNSAGKVQRYTIETWDTIGQSWRNWGRYVYSYNNDLTLIMKTDFEIYPGFWQHHYQYNNSYNNANNLVRVSAPTLRMSFLYDINGNVLSRVDTIYDFSPGSGWVGSEKYDFTYGGTRLLSYTVQVPVNSFWTNRDKFEHTYNGNNLDYTVVYSWNNNAWETKGKHVFTYDGNGNKIQDEWQTWDAATSSFKSTSRKVWTYNNFGQPLTYYSETYNAAAGSWSSVTDDFLYRYYYQAFVAAPVNDLPDVVNARLYPLPAQNVLNVDFGDNSIKGILSVFDVQGRTVKTQNVSGSGHESIDVSNLPAGAYYLRLAGGKAPYSASFIVAR